MELKKNYWLMLLLTVLAVSFTSCGSDDDDDDSGYQMGERETELMNKLQGSWQFSTGRETAMGYTFTMTNADLENIKKQYREHGIILTIYDQVLTFAGRKVNDTPYTLHGTELILEGMDEAEAEGFSFKINISEITEDKLVLHEALKYGEYDIVADMTYKRK